MSKSPNSSAAEDLLESLMKEVGISESPESSAFENPENAENAIGTDSADSEALSGLISLDEKQPAINLSLNKNFPPPPTVESTQGSSDVSPSSAPDEKTRLGYTVKPPSSEEIDINNLPDSDMSGQDSPLDIPDPDRMGGGTFDMPDPDRMGGGTFDMPDPDRMSGSDLLDIPDPDRMAGGGQSLLDIPDPDVKTSIRSIGDLSKSQESPANPETSPDAAPRIRPLFEAGNGDSRNKSENTKTINLDQIPVNPNSMPIDDLQSPNSSDFSFEPGGGDSEKTVAVAAFANRNNFHQDEKSKISIGRVRTSSKAGQVFTSSDATLLQAENLRIVQQRVLELENEIDHLRQENEELSSAAEIIKTRADELNAQIQSLNTQKSEAEDSLRSEIMILKGNLQYRDQELSKARIKTEELESRLKMDLKKIRVRERELENRLELSRAEKNAIVRAKDESILEAKRKMDQMQNEIDSYRQKCLELNKLLESNHDSFKKTTRALRLALANLELSEEAKSQLKKVD